ncbi:zinc-binding dehydrogenase, partial [Methylobacterium sp. J-077]|uniref:zinc-binding dehydrogenase n=1 Tax=Methylobacterium sp. J-077 TaxID=2836656 RepID=UPI001FBBDE73
TAIQIAKHVGAKVFATAGSAEKCKFCEELGADAAIDYKQADFAEEISDYSATSVQHRRSVSGTAASGRRSGIR